MIKKYTLINSSMAGLFAITALIQFANAANLNPDGTGQALIYPYYTVNNDLNTLLSVVNTHDEVKAIKVRFLEGDGGATVLDFNLYLAPFDVWTAATAVTSEGDAVLTTTDSSCAPFLSNPEDFFYNDFTLPVTPISKDIEREGHFEIIEMGVVTDPVLALAATHVNGTPVNCAALGTAWLPGGQWSIEPTDGIGAATGGLFGHALIVDVAEGTAVSYRADTIDNFYAQGDFLHTDPGALEPSMASAHPRSLIIDSGKAIESTWTTGQDAISALFMRDQIINEYVLGSGINAKTEWVVTFPTKSFYVTDTEPRAPFNSVLPATHYHNPSNGACETLILTYYDREHQTIDTTGSLPGLIPGQYKTCWNSNVVQMYNPRIGQPPEAVSPILGSTNVEGINTNPYEAGLAVLEFTEAQPLTDANNLYTYQGYPVTGFAVQTYTNTNAQPGLLAQYGALFNHTYRVFITSANTSAQ